MDYTGFSGVKGNLSHPDFIKKLESLSLLAKKLLKNPRFMVKFWQGKEGFEFSEYRRYVPGDDLRMVDWNIYRRLREIVVREFVAESPTHLTVALDVSPSMAGYNKLVHAKRIAASLCYIGLSLLDRVTFFPFPQPKSGTFVWMTCRSRHNIVKLFHLLEEIAIVDPEDMKDTFARARRLLPRHSNNIVLGDFYETHYSSALPLLNIPGHECSVIQLISAKERNPDFKGVITLQDYENKQKQTLHMTSTRLELYRKQFHRHLSQVKSFCTSHRISYMVAEAERELTITLPILQISGILK